MRSCFPLTLALMLPAAAQPVIAPASTPPPTPAIGRGFRASDLTPPPAKVPTPASTPVSPGQESTPSAPAPEETSSSPKEAGSVTVPISSGAISSPFQLGKISFKPHANYRLMYSDGLLSQPGRPSATTINEIAAGLLTTVGDHWTLDYTLVQTIYSQKDFKNSLDHNVTLGGGGGLQAGNWLLGFNQGFSSTTALRIETAQQTKQSTSTTGLTAAYPFGPKLSLDLAAAFAVRSADSVGRTRDLSGTSSLGYLVSKRVHTAIGLTTGVTDIADQPNLSYQRLFSSVAWKVGDKLGIDLSGGVDRRDSQQTGAAATNNLTYNFGLGYAPFQQTRLSLSAGRSFAISLFQNRDTSTKNVAVSLSQRLMGHLNLSVSLARQSSGFATAANVPGGPRDDQTQSFNAALGMAILRHGTIGVSYATTTNNTNTTGFGFSSKQIGLNIGFSY